MNHCQLNKVCWVLATLFALCLVTACGQKGDLYHPDEQQSSLSVIPSLT